MGNMNRGDRVVVGEASLRVRSRFGIADPRAFAQEVMVEAERELDACLHPSETLVVIPRLELEIAVGAYGASAREVGERWRRKSSRVSRSCRHPPAATLDASGWRSTATTRVSSRPSRSRSRASPGREAARSRPTPRSRPARREPPAAEPARRRASPISHRLTGRSRASRASRVVASSPVWRARSTAPAPRLSSRARSPRCARRRALLCGPRTRGKSLASRAAGSSARVACFWKPRRRRARRRCSTPRRRTWRWSRSRSLPGSGPAQSPWRCSVTMPRRPNRAPTRREPLPR